MSVTVMRYGNANPASESDSAHDLVELYPVSEDEHLADAHNLRKVAAYVRNDTIRERSRGAERVARFRQGKKRAGEVQVWLSAGDEQRLKAAGGLDALIAAERARTLAEATKPISAGAADSQVVAVPDSLMTWDEAGLLWVYRTVKAVLRILPWAVLVASAGLAGYAVVTWPPS